MKKGKSVAYVRVSTFDQNEARQREALEKYYLAVIVFVSAITIMSVIIFKILVARI